VPEKNHAITYRVHNLKAITIETLFIDGLFEYLANKTTLSNVVESYISIETYTSAAYRQDRRRLKPNKYEFEINR
jgi:hypothetical protein